MRAVVLILTFSMPFVTLADDPATADQAMPDFHAMQQAYQDGRITAGLYVELAIQALNDPAGLDSQWMTEQRTPEICLTPIIGDIAKAAQHDPEAQAALLLLPTRHPKQTSFVSPDGLFTIHYDTTGYHTVLDSDVDIDPADGVPDFVNRCAEIFDYCWHFEVDTLGYDPPGSDYGLGGSDNYDVYFHHIPQFWGGAYADPDLSPPEYPDRPDACCTHILVDTTFEEWELEGWEELLTPLECLEQIAAHEFHHACQASYDWDLDLNRAWMEQTAQWMSDVVYDEPDAYRMRLGIFFDNPHIYLYNTSLNYFMYGACPWPFFLEQHFGRDLMRQVWEECIPEDVFAAEAVDIVLQGLGTNHGEVVPEFRVWNYFTGERNDGFHYEEGDSWPPVHVMTEHTEFPVIDAIPLESPEGLACNYIEFPDLNTIDHLRIVFTDENTPVGDWAVSFILWNAGTSEVISTTIEDGEGEVVLFPENASTVVMIPTSTELAEDYAHYAYSVWANEYVVLREFMTEDQGDGDGRFEAGETFNLGALFYSIAAEWENAGLTVSTDDSDLEIIQGEATGQSASPGEIFEFPVGSIIVSVTNTLQETHMVSLELHVGAAGEEPLRSFEIDIVLGIPHYLLVDDDGGDFVEGYVEATFDSLDLLFDLWDDEAQMFPACPLAALEPSDYDSAIVWITGDAGNHLDLDDTDRIVTILDNGGHLLLSGQDIAESLSATAEGTAFMEEWLGVQYDGLETRATVKGATDDPSFTGMRFVTSGGGFDGADNQQSRDRLIALADASACLEYDPTGYPAAISRDWGSARLILAGFGIEAIVDDSPNFNSRRDFLFRSLDWLADGLHTDENSIPTQLRITRIWPNPSSGVFRARFASPETLGDATVSLINLAGRHVTQLYTDTAWNRDDATVTFRIPNAVANGIYMIRVTNPETSVLMPLAIIR